MAVDEYRALALKEVCSKVDRSNKEGDSTEAYKVAWEEGTFYLVGTYDSP